MVHETRNSISDIWGERMPYRGEWSVRVDKRVLEEPERWVQSACVLCSNGCGMDIGVKDGRIVRVQGREADIANRGRLEPCMKLVTSHGSSGIWCLPCRPTEPNWD